MMLAFFISEYSNSDDDKNKNKIKDINDPAHLLASLATRGDSDSAAVSNATNKIKLCDYIDSVFPIVFSTKDSYTRLMSEITNSHLLMAVFLGTDRTSRLINLIEFITLVNLHFL